MGMVHLAVNAVSQFFGQNHKNVVRKHDQKFTRMPKAVKPGADINENVRSVVLRTTNPFLFVTQNLCTRSRCAGPAQNSQQSSSSVQKIPNHFQVFLNETNIF